MPRIPMTSIERELPPTGNHPARLIWELDLGVQETNFNGEKKVRRQVLLGWELVNELMRDGRPFMACRTYSASLHPKSALGQTVVSLRGRSLTKEEQQETFDPASLLGVAALITLAETETGGRKIIGLAPVPRGMDIPEAQGEILYFAMVEGLFSEETLNKVPEYWRDLIRKSPTYQEFADDVRF